jgi:2-hydroxy-3-oxopropionate reductase
MNGFAVSRVLEVHGERMLRRTFEPGFRIALHSKDLDLALGGARTLGLALPATAGAQQLFNACIAAAGAQWDHAAMVGALENLSGHELGSGASPASR